MPAVADTAEVHKIVDAMLSVTSHDTADDVERVLIEYIGHSTLLNRQPGGIHRLRAEYR